MLAKKNMDTRQAQPRNGACNNYQWSAPSAWNKAKSNVSINAGPISKQVTGPHNPNTDAYRNCLNCGKHFNYHGKNDNSYKFGQFNVTKPSGKN